MTKIVQLIEDMRARLLETANNEQDLIRALNDALKRADHHLLQEVRAVTAEHETRRGAILNELQLLASRIGALPAPRATAGVGVSVGDIVQEEASPRGHYIVGRGDWRQAASNIDDEIEYHLNGRGVSH